MSGFRLHVILAVIAMVSLIAAGAAGHAANLNAFSFSDITHSSAVEAHHGDHETAKHADVTEAIAAAHHEHGESPDCGGDMCVSVFVLPSAPVFQSSPAVQLNAHVRFQDFALSSVDAGALQRPPRA